MHLCVKISTTFMAPIAFAVATVLFNWRVHHNVHEVLDCFASYECVCVVKRLYTLQRTPTVKRKRAKKS